MQILPGLSKALADLFSHDEALGLPKGTVRGIVFILMTATICVMAARQIAIPAEFAAAWGGIVGLYFGQKTNGHEPPKPV